MKFSEHLWGTGRARVCYRKHSMVPDVVEAFLLVNRVPRTPARNPTSVSLRRGRSVRQMSTGTLREVARRAGVSEMTVSRVLRNSGYAAPATRERMRRERIRDCWQPGNPGPTLRGARSTARAHGGGHPPNLRAGRRRCRSKEPYARTRGSMKHIATTLTGSTEDFRRGPGDGRRSWCRYATRTRTGQPDGASMSTTSPRRCERPTARRTCVTPRAPRRSRLARSQEMLRRAAATRDRYRGCAAGSFATVRMPPKRVGAIRSGCSITSGQGGLEQGQQPAPGPLRLRFVVHGGIRRAPAVQSTRVDFDLCRPPRGGKGLT